MDTESVLRSLNARQVRYVIIGASAFPAHGYGRTTLDLDVLIEPTEANAERTRTFRITFAFFASLDDLIKMKRAANRPKDREDLKALLAIRKIKQARTKKTGRRIP